MFWFKQIRTVMFTISKIWRSFTQIEWNKKIWNQPFKRKKQVRCFRIGFYQYYLELEFYYQADIDLIASRKVFISKIEHEYALLL